MSHPAPFVVLGESHPAGRSPRWAERSARLATDVAVRGPGPSGCGAAHRSAM